MGCDIHVQLERFWKGHWVGVPNNGAASCERNYQRFALLAGVRGDGREPIGLPEDVSHLSEMLHEDWGEDAHSASWETLRDFVRICLETENDPASTFLKEDDPRQQPYLYYFGLYVDEGHFDFDEYRVVFWFDN